MNKSQIFELIVKYVTEITQGVDNKNIGPGSMLSPLGADSIGRAELIEKMLETLNLDAPRYEFHAANNLGELADMFVEKIRLRQA